MSKEADEYWEEIRETDKIRALEGALIFTDYRVPSARKVITESFDAGIAFILSRRIKDFCLDQLKGMSEDYRAGYLQAQKDLLGLFHKALKVE